VNDRIFLDFSAAKLRQLASRIETCLGKLSDDQVWARGSENENAVGNLALHLCGNARQWILSGVGGAPDTRQRDSEFNAQGGYTREQLAAHVKQTVDEAARVVESIAPERLAERIKPQGYDVTVLEAIYHVVEHFAMHTGQILFATKMLTGEELGFYRHLKATAKSQGEKLP
jgi:uncharacterized damage-inducible protein DinB